MKQRQTEVSKKLKSIYGKTKRFSLTELISRLPKNYKAEKFPKSKPVGKEVW